MNLSISSIQNNNTANWAIWIDVNKNGSFRDAEDIFISNTETLSIGVNHFLNTIQIPILDPNKKYQEMVMRVVTTSNNVTLTKAMNGKVNLTNGEVEDYYLSLENPISLPLSIIDFNVKKINEQQISYRLETNNESGIKELKFLASTDSRNWEVLSTFLANNNESQEVNIYTDIVNQAPISDQYYYKIEIVNLDGSLSYTKIHHLNYNRNSALTIYPNPAKDVLFIQNLNANKLNHFTIFDATGRVILISDNKAYNIVNNITNQISLEKIPAGIYTIKLEFENVTYFEKFIKE